MTGSNPESDANPELRRSRRKRNLSPSPIPEQSPKKNPRTEREESWIQKLNRTLKENKIAIAEYVKVTNEVADTIGRLMRTYLSDDTLNEVDDLGIAASGWCQTPKFKQLLENIYRGTGANTVVFGTFVNAETPVYARDLMTIMEMIKRHNEDFQKLCSDSHDEMLKLASIEGISNQPYLLELNAAAGLLVAGRIIPSLSDSEEDVAIAREIEKDIRRIFCATEKQRAISTFFGAEGEGTKRLLKYEQGLKFISKKFRRTLGCDREYRQSEGHKKERIRDPLVIPPDCKIEGHKRELLFGDNFHEAEPLTPDDDGATSVGDNRSVSDDNESTEYPLMGPEPAVNADGEAVDDDWEWQDSEEEYYGLGNYGNDIQRGGDAPDRDGRPFWEVIISRM